MNNMGVWAAKRFLILISCFNAYTFYSRFLVVLTTSTAICSSSVYDHCLFIALVALFCVFFLSVCFSPAIVICSSLLWLFLWGFGFCFYFCWLFPRGAVMGTLSFLSVYSDILQMNHEKWSFMFRFNFLSVSYYCLLSNFLFFPFVIVAFYNLLLALFGLLPSYFCLSFFGSLYFLWGLECLLF